MADEALPKTLQQAILYFADQGRCFDFLKALRWPDGEVACPTCGSRMIGFLKTRRLWKCGKDHPKRQFSIKVGTIFEDSPLGLDKWLPCIWMIANCKNGVSSYEVHRALGVTQKTAWFMLHRIRLAMQETGGVMLGGPGKVVECDETWIGGKARSMNKAQRRRLEEFDPNAIRKRSGMAVVAGMMERGGRVKATVVPDVKAKTLHPLVREHVTRGTTLHTDELMSYTQMNKPVVDGTFDFAGEREDEFIHETVNHQAEEYVRGNVHTNGIENFWSLVKRALRGTYISVEPFHLFRYLDEQMFRYNERKDKDGDQGRFVKVASDVFGKRLTYKTLTGQAEPALAAS